MNVISTKGGKVHQADGDKARPACAGTGYLRGTYKATDKAVTCTRCAKATATADDTTAAPKKAPKVTASKKAAPKQKAAAKATTPKQPKAARTFDAEGVTEHKCAGACGEVKPVTKFPTVSGHGPSKRGVECRTCRDARTKAAKEKAKAA